MSQFVENSTDFAADCRRHGGRCPVVRENILLLDDGDEFAAVSRLQRKCGYVVIIPDTAHDEKALLYHFSCQRMTDVVKQIFHGCMEAPTSFPQQASEMSLGELYRRGITMPYDDCKARVEAFDFEDASP